MASNPNYGDLSVSLIVMSSQTGGTEQLVKQLASGLKTGGADVDITSMSEENLAFLSVPGVPVTADSRLIETGAGYLKRLVKDLDVLRRYRGRKVNVHYPVCDLVRTHIAAMRLAGCRDIYVSFHHPQILDPQRRHATKKALSMCRRLVVTTDQNREFVMNNGLAEAEQISVVYPGVTFSPQLNRAEARRALGLPQDKFLVGSLARITPEKRLHLVVETCAKAGADVHFVMGGQGSDQDRIRDLAKEHLPGRHTMLGGLDDPTPFLAALDAFILLGELEGFGLVYAEAAGQGVPSIACKVGGTSTAIQQDKTGYLVPVDDPVPDAVRLLKGWVDNPELSLSMGMAAREYVTRNFSKEKMTAGYVDIFRGDS